MATTARFLTGVLASLITIGLAGCGGSDSVPPPTAGTVVDKTLADATRSLQLRDPDGRAMSLSSLAGRVVVVSDSMTLCTEDCPLDTANIVTAARAANAAGLADRVVFLTVTVDPQRDTPRRLSAYRDLYDPDHALPDWHLLTGTKAEIDQLWKTLGVFYQRTPAEQPADEDWLTGKPLTYDVAHSDDVFVFDTDGHERWVVQGHAEVPDHAAVPPRLRAFLNELGHRHLDRPGPQTWSPYDVLDAVGWLTDTPLASPSTDS